MRSISIAAISVLAIALVPLSARAAEDVSAIAVQEAFASAVQDSTATADNELSATTDRARRCAFVKAGIATTIFTGVTCPSALGLCTAGLIDSGLLAGTTQFTLLTWDAGASDDFVVYSGELIISASGGDLHIHDRGVLNTEDATFFEIDPIGGGTGKFTNATGMLFAYGTSSTSGFDGTIAGRICRPGADQSEEE